MNAFKKELAGMLLDDSQSFRAMVKVVSDIDEVFANKTAQNRSGDNYSEWYTFLGALAMEMVSKIQKGCIADEQLPTEDDKSKMELFVLLEKAAGTQFEDMLYDELNDGFLEVYNEIKNR